MEATSTITQVLVIDNTWVMAKKVNHHLRLVHQRSLSTQSANYNINFISLKYYDDKKFYE